MTDLERQGGGEWLRFAPPPLPPRTCGVGGKPPLPSVLPPPPLTQWGGWGAGGSELLKLYGVSTSHQARSNKGEKSYLVSGSTLIQVLAVVVEIEKLIKAIDVSTEEVTAYVRYFDFLRRNGYKKNWAHFTVRLFVLSVSYLGNGYYSALRKVKNEVMYSDLDELKNFDWLKGWILQRDVYGQFWLIVDGETEDFSRFKQKYEELKRS